VFCDQIPIILHYNLGTGIAQSAQRRAGRPVFDSRQGQEIFLYSTESKPPLGPIQLPSQEVTGSYILGIKRPWREAHHTPPSRAEVKNDVATPPFPHTFSWRGA
jgi:hypothetical protein